MKLIITGATGVIGGVALACALSHPSIESVTVLARRAPAITHPKLTTVLKSDYKSYTSAEIEQLKGASACIWALGSPTGGMEVHGEYPRVAREAFLSGLASAVPDGKPFTFVLLSGSAVVRDQKRWLPGPLKVLQARGKVELDFAEFEAAHAGQWKSFVARPGLVVKQGEWKAMLIPGGYQISTEVLGRALVRMVVEGSEVQTLDNAALGEFGGKAVAGKK